MSTLRRREARHVVPIFLAPFPPPSSSTPRPRCISHPPLLSLPKSPDFGTSLHLLLGSRDASPVVSAWRGVFPPTLAAHVLRQVTPVLDRQALHASLIPSPSSLASRSTCSPCRIIRSIILPSFSATCAASVQRWPSFVPVSMVPESDETYLSRYATSYVRLRRLELVWTVVRILRDMS